MIQPALQDDAFLSDVRAAAGSSGYRLWWLGQSGFLLQWDNSHVLIDPYLSDSLTKKYAATDKPHVRMTKRVVDPQRLDFIDAITSSHNHTDHLDAETIRPVLGANRRPAEMMIVAPEANRTFVAERADVAADRITGVDAGDYMLIPRIELLAVPAAHEQLETDDHGHYRYLGYIFWLGGGPAIYHSGDTILYDGMVETLRAYEIDVAILPINGRAPERRVAGNLNGREAAWLAKQIGAKLVIPCHYDMFEFNTADPREQFIPECERLGQPYKILRAGERWSSE